MHHKAILDVLMGLNLSIDKIILRYGIKLNLAHIMILHIIAEYNEKEEKCGILAVGRELQKNKRRKSINLVLLLLRHCIAYKLIRVKTSGTNNEVRKFYFITTTGKMLLQDFSTLLLTQKKVSD